jgi:hypothetical protein
MTYCSPLYLVRARRQAHRQQHHAEDARPDLYSIAASVAAVSARLDRRVATPLFRQVYQRIRDAILPCRLAPRCPRHAA